MSNLRNLSKERLRALAIRMARVHTPEHNIAFMLGLTRQKLRALYSHEMQHAVITADLEIRETLFAMAKSGKNTAATIFWFKTYGSGLPGKSSSTTPKETYPAGMPPPGSVRFVSQDGEVFT